MAGFSFSAEDDLNIWQIGSGKDSYPPPRRVAFQSTGDNVHAIRMQAAEVADDQRQDLADGSTHDRIVRATVGYMHIFTEHVLTHPFIVLRRQCQVSRTSKRYHLTPFTVLPLASRVISLQGVGCLWKGLGSVIVVKGLLVLIEGCVEVTLVDKDISNSRLTPESVATHIGQKALALALVTPFFCSSLVETVQSCIASETPGVFDCLREGIVRAGHWRFSRSTRLMPIWLLVTPTILYGLLHYGVYSSTRNACLWAFSRKSQETVRPESSAVEESDNDATAALIANLVSDALLFPIETILHRLCIQGTRTIIDNVDMTGIVTPVISDYDGISDCYKNILVEEGSSGLFKGFGALVLQYAFHYAVIKLTRIVAQQVAPVFKY